MPKEKWKSKDHERRHARIIDIKQEIYRLADELETMKYDDFTPAERAALEATVARLAQVDDGLVIFT
jgi:hypothetical protein